MGTIVVCVLFILCNDNVGGNDATSRQISEYFNDLTAVMNTEEYRKADELFKQKQYEEAFSILTKAMLEHPELQKNYAVAMSTLASQISNGDKDTLNEIYLRYAKEVLPSVNEETQNVLMTFISGTESMQGNYEESKLYADSLIQGLDNRTVEYADAVYGRANIAIKHYKYEEAMPLLEDLWRHKDYYPDEIQYRNGFQLLNVYAQLNKDDFVIKIGEELKNKFKFNEDTLHDINNVEDALTLLQNLAQAYYNKGIYNKALELSDEAEKLIDKYSYLYKDIMMKNMLKIRRSNLNRIRKTAYIFVTGKPMEEEDNENSYNSDTIPKNVSEVNNDVAEKETLEQNSSATSNTQSLQTSVKENKPLPINPVGNTIIETGPNTPLLFIIGFGIGFLVIMVVIVVIKLLR